MPEAEQTPPEMPNVSTDTLKAEVLAIAKIKGVPEEKVTGATYDGKAWADLTVEELRNVKRKLLARKDA